MCDNTVLYCFSSCKDCGCAVSLGEFFCKECGQERMWYNSQNREWANGKPKSRALADSGLRAVEADDRIRCVSFDSSPPDHLSAPIAIPQVLNVITLHLIAVTGSRVDFSKGFCNKWFHWFKYGSKKGDKCLCGKAKKGDRFE